MALPSKFSFFLFSLLTFCLLPACAPKSQAETSSGAYRNSLDPVSSAMVDTALLRANQIRRENGLPELTLDPAVTAAAQAHAGDMLANHYFEHASLDGRSPFDRMRQAGAEFQAAAENIAHGQRTVDQAFQSWLNSPGHRQNLLNPRYQRQGIGWASGYWVHDFAD